ncbi:hypothetical protein [Pseudomonas mediterranea]|uniref:hypothetical protein n=1 Tax=Pseudomonas mediterranea TaxID=183795 RepID=UPI0039BE1F7C
MNVRTMNLAPRSATFFSLVVLVVFALGIVALLQMGKLRDIGAGCRDQLDGEYPSDSQDADRHLAPAS